MNEGRYKAKAVYLLDEDGGVVVRFDHAGEAATYMGMTRQAVQYHCFHKTNLLLRYEDDINEEMPSREVWCKYCKRYSASERANASAGWCIKRRAQRRFNQTCGDFKLNEKYIDNE